MKSMQLAGAEERWRRLCLPELGRAKKPPRRGKEPFPVGPRGRELVLGALLAGRGGPRPGGRPIAAAGAAEARAEGGEAVDLRTQPFPGELLAGPPRKHACPRPGSLSGAPGPAFPEQRLPPAPLVCPPPAPEQPPQPQQRRRPPESPYTPASLAAFGGSPEPPLSPRRRAAEAAGASPEIRALQQTRRLLANARERTRVHTISAAFEALRKQVPCYSYGQKLSKLAILRIACNYILSLARLADLDYSADHRNMSFSECVEQCTRTLQAEGRSKKRKE